MLLVVGSTCLQLPYNVVSEDAALMIAQVLRATL